MKKLFSKNFRGSIPGKILPFNIRHLTYPENHVYYNLDPLWWKLKNIKYKFHLANKPNEQPDKPVKPINQYQKIKKSFNLVPPDKLISDNSDQEKLQLELYIDNIKISQKMNKN